MSKKRPCPEENEGSDKDVFDALKDWIMSFPNNKDEGENEKGGGEGGFVHPSVCWHSDTRELRVSSGDNDIGPNEKVFCIPAACLVNIQKALDEDEKCCTDQQLDELLQIAASDHNQLYHDLEDCLVAWFLATQLERQQPQQQQQKRNTQSAMAPYLATLPTEEIANALPRRWPNHILQQSLQGSPLLDRVQAQKKGVAQDYKLLRQILERTSDNNSSSNNRNKLIPSLESFDQALAVVSSRAFASPERKNDLNKASLPSLSSSSSLSSCCLIPLLDLCNHQRGTRTRTKNLRYAWNDATGGMEVHATTAIAPGETLRITYGAQSNAQLLLNYGFSLESNTEPDGSSNNVYEYTVTATSTQTIYLRIGPKSYTYGPLVQVLQALAPGSDKNEQSKRVKDSPEDDMENFLNQCDDPLDEEEDDGEMDDMYMEGEVMNGAQGDEEDNLLEYSVEEQKVLDRQALESFRESLNSLLSTYTDENKIQQHYAQIFIASEQEILRFYKSAVDQIIAKLAGRDSSEDAATTSAATHISHVQQEHIVSLVEAFFQIRYMV